MSRYSPRGGAVPRMMPVAVFSCERIGQPLGGKSDRPLPGGRNAVKERMGRTAAVDLRAVDVRRGARFWRQDGLVRRSARRPCEHDSNATGKNLGSSHIGAIGFRHLVGSIRRPTDRMRPLQCIPFGGTGQRPELQLRRALRSARPSVTEKAETATSRTRCPGHRDRLT